MYKYIHEKCGGVAFESNKKFRAGDLVESKNIFINGKNPLVGSIMVCGNCGKPMKERPKLASD